MVKTGKRFVKSSHKAYVDNYLWLPIEKVAVSSVKAALTFQGNPGPNGAVGRPVRAYRVQGNHICVPRHFYDLDKLSERMEVVRIPRSEPVRLPESWGQHLLVQPRDESQEAAMDALSLSSGGVLELGCGKGKTVLAISLIQMRRLPTLVVVNNTTLLRQWAEEMKKYLGMEPTIVQGQKEDWSDLTVAMLQTLCRNEYNPHILDHYGLVFFDEAHHLAAPLFNSVCPMFHGLRYGLTATRRREDGLEALFMYHLGPVIYSDLTTDLRPNVYFIRTPEFIPRGEEHTIRSSEDTVNISLLRKWLTRREARNELILSEIEQARGKGRRILVLGHIVEHLQQLHAMCPGSGLCIGKTSVSKRLENLRGCEVVFGTVAIAAEGLDAPWLDTLFLVTPFRARGMFQQAMGRILRRHDGKRAPTVVVFEDHGIPTVKSMMRSVRRYLGDQGIPVFTIRAGEE